MEIVVGREPSPEIESAAEILAGACASRGFPVHRVAEPTDIDNRLCLYLSGLDSGYDVERLLDVGVRRNAFARLDQTQYLVRSWRGQARLHIALAGRNGGVLAGAARLVASRIAGKEEFSELDLQGPVASPAE